MEILQEIGSYAGLAAILGLAVLSALYFSQARDVKRLREWAGRAPDRAPTPAIPEPRGVVAQPIARPPASRPVPGGTPPPVPRPPGAQPATPAAASAAGATPAVAQGPDLGDEEQGEDEFDVTAMDTVVHPPPTPPEEDEQDGDAPVGDGDGASDDDDGIETEDGAEPGETGGYAAVAPDDAAGDPGDSGEMDALEPGETGEWRPEDEHSGIDFTDEHDAVDYTDERDAIDPVTPLPRPPMPPRPYERRGAPAPATGHARERGPILPPYAEARPSSAAGGDSASSGSGRRPILLALAALAAIVVIGFGVTQLIGGEDSGGGDDAGLSADGADDSGDGSPAGGGDAPPIDPADVTVAVLNGTTVPGLAATVGDRIAGAGFQLGTVTNNFDQERAESVVLYAPGAEDEAADVGRRLDISQREPIDAESQALAGDATVVVVAGADQNQ
jgi:LytR cell envelope-related transcriptional attenuator